MCADMCVDMCTLQGILDRMTPESMVKGGCDVTTMACGSTANENAFKAVFIKYMDLRRGDIRQARRASDMGTCSRP